MNQKEEFQNLMHAALTLMYYFNKFEEAENDQAGEEKQSAAFAPLMEKMQSYILNALISGENEADFDDAFDIEVVGKEIEANVEKSLEKAHQFCKSTSKANLILLGRTCKAVIEINDKVSADEKKAFDDFCKEYNLVESELVPNEEDEQLKEFIDSLNEEKNNN